MIKVKNKEFNTDIITILNDLKLELAKSGLTYFKTIKNTNDYVNGKLNMDKVKKSEKNFEKVENIVNYIYIFCFLLFLFGFLIVFDTVAIKSWSDGGNSMFFSTLIFWAAGIYILINNIKKSKKKSK